MSECLRYFLALVRGADCNESRAAAEAVSGLGMSAQGFQSAYLEMNPHGHGVLTMRLMQLARAPDKLVIAPMTGCCGAMIKNYGHRLARDLIDASHVQCVSALTQGLPEIMLAFEPELTQKLAGKQGVRSLITRPARCSVIRSFAPRKIRAVRLRCRCEAVQ